MGVPGVHEKRLRYIVVLPGSAEAPRFPNDQHSLIGLRMHDGHRALCTVASHPVVFEREARRVWGIQVDIRRIDNVDGTRADVTTPVGSYTNRPERVLLGPRRAENAEGSHNNQ